VGTADREALHDRLVDRTGERLDTARGEAIADPLGVDGIDAVRLEHELAVRLGQHQSDADPEPRPGCVALLLDRHQDGARHGESAVARAGSVCQAQRTLHILACPVHEVDAVRDLAGESAHLRAGRREVDRWFLPYRAESEAHLVETELHTVVVDRLAGKQAAHDRDHLPRGGEWLGDVGPERDEEVTRANPDPAHGSPTGKLVEGCEACGKLSGVAGERVHHTSGEVDPARHGSDGAERDKGVAGHGAFRDPNGIDSSGFGRLGKVRGRPDVEATLKPHAWPHLLCAAHRPRAEFEGATPARIIPPIPRPR
jgi:hypothetical protein